MIDTLAPPTIKLNNVSKTDYICYNASEDAYKHSVYVAYLNAGDTISIYANYGYVWKYSSI